MEHYVIVDKLCSCAKKQGMSQAKIFNVKQEANEAAQVQLAHMQESFCGKHSFDLTEVDDHYVIGMLGGCDCSKSQE